jgi:hypothetical protein
VVQVQECPQRVHSLNQWVPMVSVSRETSPHERALEESRMSEDRRDSQVSQGFEFGGAREDGSPRPSVQLSLPQGPPLQTDAEPVPAPPPPRIPLDDVSALRQPDGPPEAAGAL